MRKTSITATGRLLTCAALALGLTGLRATVARAQDTEVTKTREVNNEWTSTDTSPCTNESVNLQGKEVLVTKEKTSAGKTTFKFTSHQSGSGTGQNTGDRYKYSNRTENEMRTSTCKFTTRFEILKKIIRVDCPEWRNDDFFLHHLETMKVDNCRVTQVSQEKIKSRCK